MSTKQITFQVSHPYEISGKIDDRSRNVWFILHGYAQLAKDFIREFRILRSEDTVLIAPQGLSRFYTKGFKGVPGASWMTTESREMEISNYISYLNSIYMKEVKDFESQIKLSVLGFSPGAATASRWLVNSDTPFDRLILWGGFLAHEIGREKAQQFFTDKNLIFVHGKNDPFFSPKVESNTLRKLGVLGLNPKRIVFDGAHEIHAPTLEKMK
jgi:predicted esterase